MRTLTLALMLFFAATMIGQAFIIRDRIKESPVNWTSLFTSVTGMLAASCFLWGTIADPQLHRPLAQSPLYVCGIILSVIGACGLLRGIAQLKRQGGA